VLRPRSGARRAQRAPRPGLAAERGPQRELADDEGGGERGHHEEPVAGRVSQPGGRRAGRGGGPRAALAHRQETEDQQDPRGAGNAPGGRGGRHGQAQQQQAERWAERPSPANPTVIAAGPDEPPAEHQAQAGGQEHRAHRGEPAALAQAVEGHRGKRLDEANAAEPHAGPPVVDHGDPHGRLPAERRGRDLDLDEARRPTRPLARRAPRRGRLDGRGAPPVHHDPQARGRGVGRRREVLQRARPRAARLDVEAQGPGGGHLGAHHDRVRRAAGPLIGPPRKPGGHAGPWHARRHVDVGRAQEKAADRSGGILGGQIDELSPPDPEGRDAEQEQSRAQPARGVCGAHPRDHGEPAPRRGGSRQGNARTRGAIAGLWATVMGPMRRAARLRRRRAPRIEAVSDAPGPVPADTVEV
jgi:hypothetical protein